MTMKTSDYEQKLALKMVTKFVNELYEKTGMKASVKVDRLKVSLDDQDPIKGIISLDILESKLLNAYPIPLDKNPLHTKSRRLDYVEARCIFCFIACRKLKFTLTSVGKFLGRDHTTIIHMNTRAENLLETDVRFSSLFETVYNKLNQEENVDSI